MRWRLAYVGGDVNKVSAKPWPGAVGEAWRIVYQAGNPNNRTLHIRAIVDGCAVVCAIHSPHRGWRHVIEHREFLDDLFARGNLKRSRAKFRVAM